MAPGYGGFALQEILELRSVLMRPAAGSKRGL